MADSPIEFEFERAYDRDDLATVFREFADALAADRPLQLDDGERTATVTIPPRVVAEFEAEHDAEESPLVAELELELEWDDPDGSSIHVDGESEHETPGVVGIDDQSDGEPEDESDAESEIAEAEQDDPQDQDQRERTSRFEVYEDRAGQWRWRLVHWNGNIVADSGEGYTSRSNARRAARSVMRSAPTASIENLEN